MNNPTRERQSATEPPPSQQFTASATQWEMYDAYMEDQLRIAIQKDMMKKQKQREKEAEEAEEAGEPLPKKKDEPVTVPKEKKPEMMAGVPMTRAVKVMERMVNQNSYDDIAQDFKYWEDQSGSIPGRGRYAVTAVEVLQRAREAPARHGDRVEPRVPRSLRRRVRLV